MIVSLCHYFTENTLYPGFNELFSHLRPALTKPGQSRQKYLMVFEWFLLVFEVVLSPSPFLGMWYSWVSPTGDGSM